MRKTRRIRKRRSDATYEFTYLLYYRVTLLTLFTLVTDMPIDIETFDEGDPEDLNERTNAEKVLRFLFENRDKAFTPSEIAEGAGVKRNSVGTVLSRLEGRELVRHKGDYWAIGDLERVRSAYSMHETIETLDERYGSEDLDEWREHAADGQDR